MHPVKKYVLDRNCVFNMTGSLVLSWAFGEKGYGNRSGHLTASSASPQFSILNLAKAPLFQTTGRTVTADHH
jgi:hypothetical protein